MGRSNNESFSKYPIFAENKWADNFKSMVESSLEKNKKSWTSFTDPRQQQIARDILKGFQEVRAIFFGGYPAAERVRIFIAPASLPPAHEEDAVSCLSLSGFPQGILNHRDFLGSVLALGIKREVIGDIIHSGGENAFVFLIPEMVSYVRDNLQKIGYYTVEIVEVEIDAVQAEIPAKRLKEIKGTVPSMRLDVVAGLGFGLSRSRIAPLIRGEQVKLNYQVIRQPSKVVKVGDLISIIGKGRVEIADSKGETRKGRIHLLLHRVM